LKTFQETIEYIGGSREKFDLEVRIFNISCIVISLLALLATMINIVLQVNFALTIITFVAVFIFSVFFYFSRYRKKFNVLYLPFLLLINIIAGILWFLNGGTQGPISFGYILLVTFAVIIGKKRDQVFLVTLIIAMLFFLFVIEYKYPLSIVGYKSEQTRFFDFTSTLIIFVFLTSIIVRALKSNYDIEREHALSHEIEIANSMNYAMKIQNAILVNEDDFVSYFNDAFLLSKPREAITGDFYWIKRLGTRKIIVAADSTGKGLAVAFMSILGITLLNEIIANSQSIGADEILNRLRNRIAKSFRKNDSRDAIKFDLDISLCIVDESNSKLEFAGAGNPIYLIRNGILQRLDADRLPISFEDIDILYSKKEIELRPNDCIYLFTDGYIDQFGGNEGKKFMSKQFKELLIEIHQLEMAEQKNVLLKKHDEWKGKENSQTDDMLIIGIRV
jgi:serine phosphatase RsbU (regulator of sigma subunit)